MRMKRYRSFKSNGTLRGFNADIFAGVYTDANYKDTTNRENRDSIATLMV